MYQNESVLKETGQSDEQILTYEVSDAALEAAADTLPGAAMSMPNAPTVSILVVCCGND